MKVLVTGSNGFVGKNLISFLNLNKDIEIYKYDRNSTLKDLNKYTKDCDFVYHLAGSNRPKDIREYHKDNVTFTEVLLDNLKSNNNKCPIMISSSVQANLDNDYGKSKKLEEELVLKYGKDNDIKTFIYRFYNIFGKWCKPNYNSVIATWCYNIANNLEIKIDDKSKKLTLCYIDDVCIELLKCLNNKEHRKDGFCYVPKSYTKTLGYISKLIRSFKDNNIFVPTTGNDFIKKLYSTYISYIPFKNIIVDLEEHRDDRGCFCELVRTTKNGQISFSTTHPNIVRGGHYHHTKIERFIVIKGKAKIEFENIIDHSKYELEVSSDKLQYVTIPPGYNHIINNIGNDELVLIIWTNELYDKKNPDTYIMEE